MDKYYRLLLESALLGYAPELVANIRLCWKGLPWTSIIAYYWKVLCSGKLLPNLQTLDKAGKACRGQAL
jgi:hypothetical protein